ncbi:MAG TPA: hypothetical protein DCM64_00870 [Gammaproteobacteria bacterium]|jgi:hypothetical protein|nr:hypothetical protein [Gammaproteobacteria bacterium]MDP6733140.1 hypothetical protein [Gammaproteobacteria bacterium]HAJ74987.1 hypothetical protein [Gammaproteobacteria bacterium]|tara:strand:- start:314 stop:706 length:393 start_codon:yes stop_codon:yes gene_type:complete
MRLNNIRFAGSLITVIAIMFAVVAPSSAQTNMAGSWTLEVSSDQGITTPELTLVQEGMKLTGHYSSDTLGENDITGEVDGNNVTISFDADLQGQSAPVSYKGTVDAEGVWSGTLDIAGGLLTGTFTAKKK